MMYRPSTARVPGKRTALCLAIVTAALGCATQTHAQDNELRSLEEVIVTANRREESIQSIATSIQAVTGSDLDNRGISNFAEMAEAVSGLNLVQPEGAISASVYVRGVGSSGTSAADPSVGLIVDGVYQIRQGAVFTEMMDIERVEVLRGPQGTLFGKNTTAGAIRIETAKPKTDEFSGRVQTVVGNMDTVEVRGLVNIPLIEDKLAMRVNAFNASAEGHTENTFINKDTRNSDREGGRAKFLWNATDTVEVLFSAEKILQHNRMDQAVTAYPQSKINSYGSQLPPVKLGKYAQQAGSTDDEIERYILTVNWDLGNHTVSSISAYEDSATVLNTDLEGSVLNRGYPGVTFLSNAALLESTSQEFQLSSNFDGSFNYIVGAFWQNEKLTSISDIYVGGSPTPRQQSVTDRDSDSTAVFGNVSYDFTDQLNASVGVRYTEDDKMGSNSRFTGVKTFDETTYSAKIRYQIDDEKMVYFAYDTGFKSGGINRELSATCATGGRCLTDAEATWAPETTTNYEIGLKSQWLDNRLRTNVTAFYQTYEDFQVNQLVAVAASQLMSNAAEVTSKGLEFDVTYVATNNLTLAGNVSYIQTQYDSYKDAPCASTANCVGGVQDLSGETLDNAPELTYSLSGEYRDAFGETGLEWFSRLEVMYKDDLNLYVFQPKETEQDAYYLANASLGVESPDNWKVTGWVRNLADEDYVSWAAMDDSTGLRQIPGMPRTYGVSFDLYF